MFERPATTTDTLLPFLSFHVEYHARNVRTKSDPPSKATATSLKGGKRPSKLPLHRRGRLTATKEKTSSSRPVFRNHPMARLLDRRETVNVCWALDNN